MDLNISGFSRKIEPQHMGMDKRKVLIIGDNLVSARDTANILRDLDYSVVALVAVGANLVPIIEKKRPHLVLVNGHLRGERAGIETARRVSEGLDVPVLILVDRAEIKAVKQSLKKLCCSCLLKPVDKQSLEVAIETALARHALEKKIKDRAKNALQESEERYYELVDNISEGVVIQDKNGIITSANERFLEMIGYKRREVIGRPITGFLGEGWLKKAGDSGVTDEDRWRSVELAWKRKDGKRIYTILSRKPIYGSKGQFEGSVSVLTDITDRREVELELRRSQEELRSLSHHIQSVRENESRRIASEIHDVLGQQLTALKIDLSWLTGRVAPLGESGKEIQAKIDAMSDLIDKTCLLYTSPSPRD